MQGASVSLVDLVDRRASIGGGVGALDFLIEFYKEKGFLNSFENVYRCASPKSNKYESVRKLSFDISKKTMAQELGFLLEYANSIRNVQMTSTYVSMIFFAVSRASDGLDQKVKAQLAQHVRNVFLVCQDDAILEALYKRCPSVIGMISLPDKIKEKIRCFPSGLLSKRENVNNLVFDKFDDRDWLAVEDYSSLENWQQVAGLSINHAALCDPGSYPEKLNQFLSKFGLLGVSEVSFSDNVLKGVVFDKGTVVDGDKVSIIMSCYNAGETVAYALRSLLQQTYVNIEILVCDDGSSDNSLAVLKEFSEQDSRVKVYESRSNQGTYNIRNSLIPLCSGKYITFHDSDDLAHPQRIEMQVRHMEDGDYLVSSCKWVRFDKKGNAVFFVDGQMIRFCVVSTMVERSVFSVVPKFRESLVAADTEFHESCLYLLGHSKVGVLDVPLIFGLWGDGSLTKAPGLTAENSGFVAERRREYSEVAARQRVLGSELIADSDVVEVLKSQGIHREFSGVTEVLAV